MSRISASPLVELGAAVDGAASVAMTTGATTAGAASAGTRVGAGDWATASTAGEGTTTVGTVAAAGTAGTGVAIGAGGRESVACGKGTSVAADTTGLAELPAEVGRGVIVAPVTMRGVAMLPPLDDAVGLAAWVLERFVGVAVGDGVNVGVRVGVAVAVDVRVGVGVSVAGTPDTARIGPW